MRGVPPERGRNRRVANARGAVAVLVVLVVVFLAVVLIGIRRGHGGARPETAPPAAEPPAPSDAFGELRPHAGDQMAPPCIGFRWRFDASRIVKAADDDVGTAAGQAPLEPHVLAQPDSTSGRIRFRVHLRGADGLAEIARETTEEEIRIELPDSFPEGECTWWVEAFVPGEARCLSPSESFELRP